MGDRFESMVDVDASPNDASRLAAELVAWLVELNVIRPELTDCVLDARPGHPPGANWKAITEDAGPDASWEQLTVETMPGSNPGRDTDEDTRPSDGVQVVASRNVFGGAQGSDLELECPQCSVRTGEDHPQWRQALDALEPWYRTGSCELGCVHCGYESPIEYWRFLWEGNDWLVLANLGLVFWNWPPLADSFVREVSRRLGGHRIRVVDSKL